MSPHLQTRGQDVSGRSSIVQMQKVQKRRRITKLSLQLQLQDREEEDPELKWKSSTCILAMNEVVVNSNVCPPFLYHECVTSFFYVQIICFSPLYK